MKTVMIQLGDVVHSKWKNLKFQEEIRLSRNVSWREFFNTLIEEKYPDPK